MMDRNKITKCGRIDRPGRSSFSHLHTHDLRFNPEHNFIEGYSRVLYLRDARRLGLWSKPTDPSKPVVKFKRSTTRGVLRVEVDGVQVGCVHKLPYLDYSCAPIRGSNGRQVIEWGFFPNVSVPCDCMQGFLLRDVKRLVSSVLVERYSDLRARGEF